MKIKIDISDQHDEPSITIHAREWTGELEELVGKLRKKTPKRILGIKEDQSILLFPEEIEFIFADNRKVYASVDKENIELKMKLFEVESLLEENDFIRFSKSVIGNINKIARFELAFNGNLCVYFQSGEKEYVSRKYVPHLKEKLIIGADKHGK